MSYPTVFYNLYTQNRASGIQVHHCLSPYTHDTSCDKKPGHNLSKFKFIHFSS